MATEQPNNLQQLAKQANPKAIAALLNRSLQAKSITAKVSVKNGCLQIMLEATKVPPKQPYIDSLRKWLTNLKPTAVQKVRVYGKQKGEDVPEWLEEFDLSTQPTPNLSELAKQGDEKAINVLLNQWLQPHAVVAKVRVKSDSLQVMLESTKIPDREVMIELIKTEISKLGLLSITKMKLFGQERGEDFPDWHQEISLNPEEISAHQVSSYQPTSSINEGTKSYPVLIPVPKIDVAYFSNQVYNILINSFNEFVEVVQEKVFVTELLSEMRLVFESIEKPLIDLCESIKIRLNSAQLKSITSDVYDSSLSEFSPLIQELEENIEYLYSFNVFQEEDSLLNWEVAKSAAIGFFTDGILGSARSAYSSWQAKKKQEEEIQLLLIQHEEIKDKILKKWTIVLRKTYKFICKILSDSYNITLIDYQVFEHYEELCIKTIDYFENHKFAEAIATSSRAIELNPVLLRAWNFRGCALYRLEQYEEAIKDFDRAIEIDCNSAEVWQNKADALQSIGQYQDAIVAYDKVISFENENYLAWLNRSNSLFNLGRYNEAIKSIDIAISIESEDYEAWYIRASCVAWMQNSEQVLESLQKALELNLEECRERVNNDSCFDFIRNNENFKALLEDSSVGIDYSVLKQLLVEKRWEEADWETSKIMCEVVTIVTYLELSEEEEEEFLSDPNNFFTELTDDLIEKIPCVDLNTIDKLWVEHSNGKFGFSIQKEIYQSLGGTQEFDGEIRDQFGNQTGWRVHDNNDNYVWRRSDEFEYDFEQAPKGHLPSCLWAGEEDSWFSTNRRDRLIALFVRMYTCSIRNLPKNTD